MRVRVWISGEDGPAHDFELLSPPRVGDIISIALGREQEEGMVTSVSWHLQGIERMEGDLALEGEPVGSVNMVHVICTEAGSVVRLAVSGARVDLAQASGSAA